MRKPTPASDDSLPTASIVVRAMHKARHATAMALLGSVAIVAAVLAERHWHGRASAAAAEQLRQAERAAGALLLADEQLTMSAVAAAQSGEMRWVQRYGRHLSDIDRAIAQAQALASPDVARRFDEETRVANDRLVELEKASFDAIVTGDVARAKALLDSAAYAQHKATLSEGTRRFLKGMLDGLSAEQRRIHNVSAAFGLALTGLAVLGALAIWRRLTTGLDRSRDYFLDAEQRIQHLAATDVLTGMANRAALHDAMGGLIARARGHDVAFAVLLIDLDRFKPINDRHGHLVGDLVLKEVALRLSRALRQTAPRARYGGDEFVVLLDEGGEHAARTVAERILRVLSEPMSFGDLTVQVGACIGIARFPQDGATQDELLRKADLALYRAKQEGRGQACFYDAGLEATVIERESATQRLREAIRDGEIVPFYQPIVDLADGRVRGLELLSRWQHPARGTVPPAEFIPLAEASSQLGALTMSVLRQACADMARFPAHWRLALNIAPYQIQDETLVPQILAVLHEAGVAPQRLEIELTETALVSDIVAARRVIATLKEAGMTVALDDFGTGYSSLCYLTELTFDKIKIDRSFVRTLHERSESTKVVTAIVGLSRSLGVQTVAEGVESERDAHTLAALGCGGAQGYYFARPMSAAQLLEYARPQAEAALAPA